MQSFVKRWCFLLFLRHHGAGVKIYVENKSHPFFDKILLRCKFINGVNIYFDKEYVF